MGVTQLWQVLSPVEHHVSLSSLNGQTLAVDLSIWVCENQSVKQMQGVVAKPFLRNLFFRISHLTQLGVKLVFVIEGAAPELKWDTMVKRQQSRFPGRPGKQSPPKQAGKQTRRNFNCWLKECCELLEIMGIPYIQSKSEAEALCALLNAAGLVDGCLTNDGDAFLYGAKRVYRNFTMNSKDPHVEMFDVTDIESKLGIDRSGLVALGLLVGCDFVPKGVPGIGVANSVRLLQSLRGQDVLTRLQLWKTMSEKDCVDQVEVLARRKAIQVPEFPQTKVIDEFLVVKDRCPSQLPQWKRPVLAKLQEFALIKLEWPVEYTLEKILPLMTLWDMQDILQSRNPSVHQHLKPHRIVKTRIRQGEPCYEVEWNKPVTECVNEDLYYVTVESQDLFSKCYSVVVKAFESEVSENKKKPKAKKKKKKQPNPTPPTPVVDNLSFQFGKINLNSVTSGLQKSLEDVHPSFSEYNESTLTTKAKQPRHLTLSPNRKKPATKTTLVDSKANNCDSISGPDTNVSKTGGKLNFEDEGVESFVEDEEVMSLSQRVKLRMQNKTESNKVNLATPGKCIPKSSSENAECFNSLLEDVSNLSIGKGKPSVCLASKSKLSDDSSPALFGSKLMPSCTMFRNNSLKKSVQQMSSPSTDAFCSPMTYMKHKGDLGDSFEIQRSPYYIECPSILKQRSGVNELDINSPGYFSRQKSVSGQRIIDSRSTAEKLVEKIESGIQQVGSGVGNGGIAMFESKKLGSAMDEQITLKSLQSLLNNSNGSVMTPKNPSNKTCGFVNQSALNCTEFGDFQLQTSLMNSLCSSLVQALTPKGVSMTKAEYEQLVATLNEIESEENTELTGLGDREQSDLEQNIDFAEIEKVSTNFKNMNQNLLLRPIQIDDEDVMSKLSKSARKKLRRKERKVQEMENMVKLQNMSQKKQKLNKKQESDLKTRLSHPNDNDNDGNKRKKQIICSPSKDSSKSKTHSHEGRNKGGQKHNTDAKNDTKVIKDVKSPVLDTGDPKCGKDRNICAEVKYELKQANDAKLIQADRKQNGAIVDGGHLTEMNKKKKKRKKKVKKASPVIDLSANDSILDDGKVAVCAEYLKKALENSYKMQNGKKIEKASPFMNLSADDTLLELEGISCKVVGEELDSDLDSKLKIKSMKQKKILSRNKICALKAEENGCAHNPPILSLVNVPTETDYILGTETEGFRNVTKIQDMNPRTILQNGGGKSACGQESKVMPIKGQPNVCKKESVSGSYFDAFCKETQNYSGSCSQNEEFRKHNEDANLHESASGYCIEGSMQQYTLENDDRCSQWCYKMEDLDVNCSIEEFQHVSMPSQSCPDIHETNVTGHCDNDVLVVDCEEDVEGAVANGNVHENNGDNDRKAAVALFTDGHNASLISTIECGAHEDIDDKPNFDQEQKTVNSSLQCFENETYQLEIKNRNYLTQVDTSNCMHHKLDGGEEVEHSKKFGRESACKNLKMDEIEEYPSVVVSSPDIPNEFQYCKSEKTLPTEPVENCNDSSSLSENISEINKDSKYEHGTFMDYWSANQEGCSNIEEMFTNLTNPLPSESSIPGFHSDLLLENVTGTFQTELSPNSLDKSLVAVTSESSMNSRDTALGEACLEVVESPACLADRLKLKLTQRCTINLLDSFTNGK